MSLHSKTCWLTEDLSVAPKPAHQKWVDKSTRALAPKTGEPKFPGFILPDWFSCWCDVNLGPTMGPLSTHGPGGSFGSHRTDGPPNRIGTRDEAIIWIRRDNCSPCPNKVVLHVGPGTGAGKAIWSAWSSEMRAENCQMRLTLHARSCS